eukprot:Selendium_serpulae@DN1024_c0_g1_i1.p1
MKIADSLTQEFREKRLPLPPSEWKQRSVIATTFYSALVGDGIATHCQPSRTIIRKIVSNSNKNQDDEMVDGESPKQKHRRDRLVAPFLIVDEASQVIEPAIAALMQKFGTQRVAIVGDTRQLPPTLMTRGSLLSQSLLHRICEIQNLFKTDNPNTLKNVNNNNMGVDNVVDVHLKSGAGSSSTSVDAHCEDVEQRQPGCDGEEEKKEKKGKKESEGNEGVEVGMEAEPLTDDSGCIEIEE